MSTHRGFDHRGIWPNRPPAEPTEAMPGTPEKLAVMIARVERGESPMHPADAQHHPRNLRDGISTAGTLAADEDGYRKSQGGGKRCRKRKTAVATTA